MTQAFDAYVETYGDVVERSIAFSGLKHDFFLAAKVDVLAALFRERFGQTLPSLLDIGCGVGTMHPPLAGLAGGLAGADVSKEALRVARSHNPASDYRVIKNGKLPWPDASFDAATAICVFHHVPPAERALLVAEIARVTRSGGLVVIVEHNPLNPLTRLAVARCPFDHDAVLLRAREARGLLSRAGLRRVESRHFLVFPTAQTLARRAEATMRRLPLGAQYAAIGEV